MKLIHAGELVACGDTKRWTEGVIKEYIPHNHYGSYVRPYLELVKILVILFLVLMLYFSIPKVPDNLLTTSTNAIQVPKQGQLKLLLPTYEILEIPNRTILFFDDFEKYKTDHTMNQQNGWFPIWGWSGKIV